MTDSNIDIISQKAVQAGQHAIAGLLRHPERDIFDTNKCEHTLQSDRLRLFIDLESGIVPINTSLVVSLVLKSAIGRKRGATPHVDIAVCGAIYNMRCIVVQRNRQITGLLWCDCRGC